MIDIIGLLSTDGYIMTNKTLIRKFGGDCAILMGELCAEYKYFEAREELDENGSFYSTQENIEYNTGLNSYAQRNATKILIEAGILVIDKRGMPAKNYYKICVEQLSSLFVTSGLNFKQQDLQNLNLNNNKENNNKKDSNSINRITPDDDYDSHSYSFDELKSEFVGSKKTKKPTLYSKCADEICSYTDDYNLRQVLTDYLVMRLAVKDKPIRGVNQWKGMLNKLNTLQGDKYTIVNQSLEKGWLTFYPITNNSSNKFSEGDGLSCEKSTTTAEERKRILEEKGLRSEF